MFLFSYYYYCYYCYWYFICNKIKLNCYYWVNFMLFTQRTRLNCIKQLLSMLEYNFFLCFFTSLTWYFLESEVEGILKEKFSEKLVYKFVFIQCFVFVWKHLLRLRFFFLYWMEAGLCCFWPTRFFFGRRQWPFSWDIVW